MFKAAFIISLLAITMLTLYISSGTYSKIKTVEIPKNMPVQNITFNPVFITAGPDGGIIEYSSVNPD